MAVGSEARIAPNSYVAFSKETSFGTYASATTASEVLSCGFIVERKSEKLDTIGLNRGYTKRVQLEQTVSGEIETYLHPLESVLPIAVAMGGGIASSVTAVGGVYTHSITAGNFDTSPSSMSFNVRKGATAGHVWRYLGGRVDEMKISAEIGEPVKVSYSWMFKDATNLSDDISGILSISSVLPFTFVQGKYRYSSTEALAATTTSEEPIQGFELTLQNNIADGPESRELGTNLQTLLTPVRRNIEMTIKQRFDTTTAYNRMIQATQGSIELFFQGGVITTSSAVSKNYEMTIRLPKVYYGAADTQLGGADEVLTLEIPIDVVVDTPQTTTGKDIGITFQNEVASY
jgi:hypothetical protein